MAIVVFINSLSADGRDFVYFDWLINWYQTKPKAQCIRIFYASISRIDCETSH